MINEAIVILRKQKEPMKENGAAIYMVCNKANNNRGIKNMYFI